MKSERRLTLTACNRDSHQMRQYVIYNILCM